MAMLGESLVFYLKYPAEMERLYERPVHRGEDPDLCGRGDVARVQEMALAVGTAADKQATDFLKACAEKIKERFSPLGVEFSKPGAAWGAVAERWT